MNLWVLDTDMLTLWLRGHDTIAARIAATPSQQLATTIITVEELLRGWYTQVRRAHTDEQLAWAYQALQETVAFTCGVRILPFHRPAIARCRALRFQHRRTGTNDLRIAAIALEHESILVTRNTSDFAEITGRQLEDWTKT